MAIVAIWILLCVGVGAWANSWSRNFAGWAILSVLVSPPLGAAALLIAGRNGKTCTSCAEIIKPEAIKCKHCGADASTSVPAQTTDEVPW